MCWEGKVSDKRIAKQDIIVYKVLERWGRKHKEYRSPFQKHKYKMLYRYSFKNGLEVKTFGRKAYIMHGLYCYSQNTYASFDKTEKRLRIANSSGTLWNYKHIVDGVWKTVVVECVIPKGTTYYINKHGIIVTECLYFRCELGIPTLEMPLRFRELKKNYLFE